MIVVAVAVDFVSPQLADEFAYEYERGYGETNVFAC